MSALFIHVHNSKCHSRDEGGEYESPQAALAIGVRGAIAILSEEIIEGEISSAAEVSVRSANGLQILRSVVALSISPLLPEARSPVVVPIRPDLLKT
jgi:hypothetical protein